MQGECLIGQQFRTDHGQTDQTNIIAGLTEQYPMKNGQTDQNGEQATHVDIKQAKPT